MQKIINSTIIEINLKLLKQTIQKETHKVDQFRQTEFIIWIQPIIILRCPTVNHIKEEVHELTTG
jgi:hypothetical protein